VTYIEELQGMIRKLHGAEAIHRGNQSVTEMFNGKVIWQGVVEIFELIGHESATRVYAWSHSTDDPANPTRYVTVLHKGSVDSPRAAVRAAIIQEYRDAEAAEA